MRPRHRSTPTALRAPGLALVTATLLWSSLAFGTDFTQWLGRRGWKPVERLSDGVILVEDASGRRFELWTAHSTDAAATLATSVLAAALGVPAVPTLPALAERRPDGFGPVTETTSLDGLASVFVRPVVTETPLAGRRLVGASLAELAVGLVFHALVAPVEAPRFDGTRPAFVLTNGHVVPARWSGAFDPGAMSPEEAFARAFALFPWDAFLADTWVDRDRVLTAVNTLLSRIERLEPAEWRAALGSLRADTTDGAVRATALRARARLLRGLVHEAFRSRVPAEAEQLRRPEPVDVPIVRLPPATTPWTPAAPTTDLLWQLWERAAPLPSADAFAALVATKFPSRTGSGDTVATTATSAVAVLMDGADTDMSRIYGVHAHRSPRFEDRTDDRVPQLTLFPGNEDTLVVVPLNDPEAELIEAMARESGARLLALPKTEYPHGAKLDASLKNRILSAYDAQPFRRLIVVELPGRPASLEDALRRDGRFRFFVADHHDYRTDRIFRHRAIGSAEQVADLLGFTLSPTDTAIALFDRSFVSGVLEAGFAPERIATLVPPLPPAIERLGDGVATPFGPLFVLDGFAGTIGEAAAALAVREAPAIGNLLVVEPNALRFSGHPAIEAKLTEAFAALSLPETVAHYAFGDLARSRGWGLKGFSAPERPVVYATVRTVLASVAGPDAEAALDGVLEQPMENEALNTTQRFRIADGRRRAAALRQTPWATLADEERDRFVALALAALSQESAPEAITALLAPDPAPTYTSFDFGALVDVAAHSGDARWRPYLQACLRAWMLRIERWHGRLADRAEAALATLPPPTKCAKEILE
jgi:hypothetical protein